MKDDEMGGECDKYVCEKRNTHTYRVWWGKNCRKVSFFYPTTPCM